MNTWPVGHYHQWSALMTCLHLYTYILYLDIIHIPKTHNSCVCLLQWIDVLSLLISDSLIERLSPPSQPALAKAMLYARRPSLYPGRLGWSRTIDFLYIANQCNKNIVFTLQWIEYLDPPVLRITFIMLLWMIWTHTRTHTHTHHPHKRWWFVRTSFHPGPASFLRLFDISFLLHPPNGMMIHADPDWRAYYLGGWNHHLVLWQP